MPEGDSIFRLAATLRQALHGKVVTGARPTTFKRLAGKTVVDVRSVGKHLLVDFDSGLSLHSHMGMRGAWHVYAPGAAWRRPEWQVKAVLETREAVAVCFGAQVVDLVAHDPASLRHLGPDLLGDGWSVDEVVRRARAHGATPIGELLLDQRVSAGAGNVYRCEALWQLRVNPWTPASEVPDGVLAALFETMQVAMGANTNEWRRRFPGYGKGAVHGRGGRPCPRCGTTIRVRAQGEHARLTYWCPACQAPV